MIIKTRLLLAVCVLGMWMLNDGSVHAKVKKTQKNPVILNADTMKMCDEAMRILSDTLKFNPIFDNETNDTIYGATDSEYVSPYLLPLTFYGKVSPSNFHVKASEKSDTSYPVNYNSTVSWLQNELQLDSLREQALTRTMAHNPCLIKYDGFNMPDAPKTKKIKYSVQNESLKVTDPQFEVKALQMGLPQADRWTIRLSSTIQLSQNYVSDNWYQGGESNINILNIQSLSIKRNDPTNRTEFETRIDVKASFYTTPSDTMRSFRVNDNLFQLTSKYGIRASNKWYYTGSLRFKTQLFNNYQANTNNLLTQFLSPAEANVSLGMDHKYQNKRKTFNWSILMAPLAYNLKYVRNIEEIDETKFGITEGKHSLHQIGSSLTNQFDWKVTNNIQWTSRLFFFSNYEKSQGDFENVFNFSVNRYFSTRISLHLRYDDDIKDGEDLFQFKELLSFGLNFVW